MKNITIDGYAFPGGKTHALTLSYDDAQIHDRRFVELLNKYGIRSTFHINSGKLDTENFVSAKEVSELYKGHEIAAHTVNHPFLTHLPYEQIVSEILDDRRYLEDLAGVPVRGFSYPFGHFNDKIVALLPACGIDYARTILSHQQFRAPDDFLLWHPTCHHNDKIIDRIEPFLASRSGSLFYVWGHAHEFPRNNNWEMMEEFCKSIGGLAQVWYATNAELFQYYNALRGLQYNVARNLVYNPAAVPVYIRQGGKIVVLKPGIITALSD